MAKVKTTKLAFNTPGKLETAVALNTSEGALIPMGADQKMVIIAANGASAGKEITIVAGDGFQATDNVVYSIPSSSEAAFTVESSRFLITKGDNAGHICVKGASDITVRAIELP